MIYIQPIVGFVLPLVSKDKSCMSESQLSFTTEDLFFLGRWHVACAVTPTIERNKTLATLLSFIMTRAICCLLLRSN